VTKMEKKSGDRLSNSKATKPIIKKMTIKV
jgi:hypothetical protein